MNVGNIFKVSFTKIYQCFELYKESNVLEAVSLITGKSVEEYLKCPANEAIKFMKWLEQEIEKCVQVLNSIPSVPNNDMAAAGISDLDEFGEFNIYYSITKNPVEWEHIGIPSRLDIQFYNELGNTEEEKQESKWAILHTIEECLGCDFMEVLCDQNGVYAPAEFTATQKINFQDTNYDGWLIKGQYNY
ncbi:hypothetical protein ACJJTC_011823 [Scirpophaga incertulas]